jgi:hypothetical protein
MLFSLREPGKSSSILPIMEQTNSLILASSSLKLVLNIGNIMGLLRNKLWNGIPPPFRIENNVAAETFLSAEALPPTLHTRFEEIVWSISSEKGCRHRSENFDLTLSILVMP